MSSDLVVVAMKAPVSLGSWLGMPVDWAGAHQQHPATPRGNLQSDGIGEGREG